MTELNIEIMNKFKKSQILMLFLLAALLFITPLLSSSMRPTYIYFIMNLLILALGAEAGLLAVLSKPPEDRKQYVSVAPKPVAAAQEASAEAKASPTASERKAIVVEKSVSQKLPATVPKAYKVKKCPSTPSLFFIGNGETEAAEVVIAEKYDEEDEEVAGGLSGQELFTKAETFIANFYKQLKMQREESWKRIHGFYQKAF